MIVRVAALAAALLVVAWPATAQNNPSLSEAERGIRRDDASETGHLTIRDLKADVHVVGRSADVTLDLTIASDDTDPYEAKLALDLPADAVVTGYALDVEGRMIPGQLLEQPKARNVYEAEVRAGIDPGLAEMSADNRFTTRIYPIDKDHPRRFRLTFSAPFDPARGLVLPLMRDAAIAGVALGVRVDGYARAPVVSFAGRPLDLKMSGAGWRGSVALKQATLRDGLSIAGGQVAAPLIVATRADGEAFFLLDDSDNAAGRMPRGGRLRIYWDRSLSHRGDGTAIESEALLRLVDTLRPETIDLVSFASDAPRVETVQSATALRAALARTTYRGATSLAGLDALKLAPSRSCVMVFDGQVTIDRGAAFAPDCAFGILTASPGADGARLGRIAQGGPVVRIAAGKAADAAAALARRGVSVVSVHDAGGRRIETRALPAAAGRWLLVGRMPAGVVRVRLSDGSERTYSRRSAVAGDAPAALWAAQRVQALGDDPTRHAEMVALARGYNVAGPAMALLVLDRPDQYLRADIAPPAGFSPDWMKDYRAAKKDDVRQKADDRGERFQFVLDQWQKRQEWWNTRFTPARRDKRAQGAMAGAPPPPPPPPPAPMVAAPGIAAPQALESASAVTTVGAEDIVVTSQRTSLVPTAIDRSSRDTSVKVDLENLLAKRPYLAALDAATPAARQKVLAAQETAYGSVPTFYLDVAEWFRLKADTATADQLLLSALDLPTSDDETKAIVAFRLERDRSYDRAVELAERLAAANASFRPQPGRDLALALAARGRAHGVAGKADLERAFTLLVETALNPASGAFDGIETVALMEANALIPDLKAIGGKWTLDRRLVALLDTDARIVIAWTADDADIDLWVDEPNGERVYYGDQNSSAGGLISNDMTDGYGPEEYNIRRAPPGAYRVRINGYDADRINPNGPGHVLIRLIRNFGRTSERETMVDADLSFQAGGNRDDEDGKKPVATLIVAR